MNVPGYRSSGAALCCAWIPQHRCAHPSPIVVTYALAVAQPCAWAGAKRVARCASRLRFELRGLSAPSCARCCVRLRIRCTQLSIPVATRMHIGCANVQTTAASWLQRRSVKWGDARVMDLLLGLMHRWRSSGDHTFPFVRRSGGISVNCQREISPKPTSGELRCSPTAKHQCNLCTISPSGPYSSTWFVWSTDSRIPPG
jgi:hypothetical protein